ncbi:MAG: hypothetical protein KDH94_03685 [Coxiellaceae bacterium]|nr:hypothetical protein [Coxiellaceae bacterium]
MKKVKLIIRSTVTAAALLLGCTALANGKAAIKESYSAPKQSIQTHFTYDDCGYGTHIKVINRSDYDVYVRVPAAGGPDFHLNPEYAGDNIDYIDSDDYYASLRVIVLADDDYTVLFDGQVQNCHNVYVDNPSYFVASNANLKKVLGKQLPVSEK